MAPTPDKASRASKGVSGDGETSKTRSNASRKSASVKSTPQKRVGSIRGSATKGKARETSNMSMDSGSVTGQIEEEGGEADETIVGNNEEAVGAGLTSEWVASVAATRRESQGEMDDPSSSQTVVQMLTSQRIPTSSAPNPTVVVDSAAKSSPLPQVDRQVSPEASSSTFAAGLATLRTPVKNLRSDGPDYVRSPSGSALSSLAESPASIHIRRKHRFTLEIEQQSSGKPSRGSRARSKGSVATEDQVKVAAEKKKVEEEEDDNPFKTESSDEELVDASSDSDGEDIFAQARARATARLALEASTSATTLTQTTLPPSSASAATEIVSPQEKYQPNRSSRSTAVPRPAAIASTSASVLPTVKGVQGRNRIADIIAANAKRAKKGFLTLEEAQELIDEDDDILHDPNDSDAEERRNGRLTPAQLEKLSESVVLNEDHDSTVTGSAKKRSKDVKELLLRELKKDMESGTRTLAQEKIRERSIWSWEKEGPTKPLVSIAEGSGWGERVVECFNSALLDSSVTISPMRLFSPITGIGSALDRQAVSAWLLALASHPSSPVSVAEQAIQLLHRILAHAAKSDLVSPLSLSDFVEQFQLLGAKTSFLGQDGAEAPAGDLATSSSLSDLEESVVTSRGREKCCIRLLRVLDDVASLSLIAPGELVAMSMAVLQLSLDPEGAATRRLTNSIAQHLVHQLYSYDDAKLPRALFDRIVEMYSGKERAVCNSVLEALPHSSKPCKIFRKWVAWGLLANRESIPSLIRDASFLEPPPLRLAAALIEDPKAEGPFKISPTMDDFALVSSTQSLQFLLSDLCAELGESSTRKTIKKISRTLELLDSSIRTNIRTGEPERLLAKNTITRLANSLAYLVKAAEQRAGTAEKVIESADSSDSAEETKVVKKKRKVGQKKGSVV